MHTHRQKVQLIKSGSSVGIFKSFETDINPLAWRLKVSLISFPPRVIRIIRTYQLEAMISSSRNINCR